MAPSSITLSLASTSMIITSLFVLTVFASLPRSCTGATVSYALNLKNVKVTIGGVERSALLVNNSLPGPTLRGSIGDTIIVSVTNNLVYQLVFIHFHGMFQNGTNYYDGGGTATQCSVSFGSTFVHTFKLLPGGTFWYHSHAALEYSDGTYGALIVDDPQDPYLNDYQGEYIVILSEWSNFTAETHFIRGGIDFGLIDGSINDTVWSVKAGMTYRFRFICANGLFGVRIGFANHNMTIIALDGVLYEPKVADYINVNIGERYDVLLHADLPIGVYEFQAKWSSPNYADPKANSSAYLMYEGGTIYYPGDELDDPSKIACGNAFLYTMKNVNTQFTGQSAVSQYFPPPRTPVSAATMVKLNIQIELIASLANTSSWVSGIDVDASIRALVGFDNTAFQFPSTPLVLSKGAFGLFPPETVTSRENGNWIIKTNLKYLQRGQIVDMVFNNTHPAIPSLFYSHPMHLHGHHFWVLGFGEGYFDPNNATQQAQLNYVDPIVKDVWSAEPGWSIVRFIADNPGAWLMHCHTVPDDFPICGLPLSAITSKEVKQTTSDDLSAGAVVAITLPTAIVGTLLIVCLFNRFKKRKRPEVGVSINN